jgi:N-acetylneuraminic acid mutarotase
MDINATFADLPAPELKWEEMAEAPVVRLDGAAMQINNLLYVFAGYGTINDVRKSCTSSIVSFMHYISIYPFCFNYEIYSKKNTTL